MSHWTTCIAGWHAETKAIPGLSSRFLSLRNLVFLLVVLNGSKLKPLPLLSKTSAKCFTPSMCNFQVYVRSLICLLLLLFILIFCFRFLSLNSEMTSLKLNWIIFLFISTINFAMLFVSTLPGTCDSLIWGFIWQLVVYKKDSRSLGTFFIVIRKTSKTRYK